MASPAYAILFSALVSGVSGVGAAGDVLVLNTAGSAFIISTTANRGTRRSTGVALKPYTNNSTVEIQQYGQVDASLVPALGAGTASWVRVSTTGQLERATVSGSDDVCGYVETDGTFHACFGILTAAIVNGSGGGGGATLPIDLAGGAGTVINLLPVGNQAAQTMAGDVTGTTAASTVAKVNGATYPAAGALVTGTVPRVTGASAVAYGALDLANASATTGVLPSASAPSHAGDVTGAHTATVVVKVNGASMPAAGALTTGNAAYVSGASALTYSALNLAGGAGWVTGVLPAGNQASQTMAGDVTGTTAASVVAKVNGTTYPAGGALTTGTIPRVTAAATVAYGALDLANASAVTGSLPAGNQASQTMAGDVTGTTAASVVAKINGASVIAAGALTTGHVLKVTSVSSTTYGFVADANVASGAAIAASKVVQATGTGFPHVTSSVLDAASIKVDLTNSAHVTVPATANGVVVSTGSALSQATNVLAGTNFISIGATPAAVGNVRLAASLSAYAATSGTDRALWEASDATLYLGNNASNTSQFTGINLYAGFGINLGANGTAATYLQLNSDTIITWVPMSGSASGTVPFRYSVGVINSTSITTFTATAAQYACPILQHTSSAGSGTAIWNLPNSLGAYYIVDNQSAATVLTLKVSGQTGVTIAVLKKATIYCNGTDYVRVTPDT